MMRSGLMVGSAVWFVGAAVLIGDGSTGLLGDPPNQQVIGDSVVMAIHTVARILFVGLAILVLAGVDWPLVRSSFRW